MAKKMKSPTRTRLLRRPGQPDSARPGQSPEHELTELVPVRFPPETLAKIRDAADADDRSVSAWIRPAVDHELEHGATKTG